ncbi:MAG: pyrimidine 5'-nucleotidase [Deferribacterota bacterium]|nr:pyrimidine 5'-nucleotidase [Deferribacterota bacterium]
MNFIFDLDETLYNPSIPIMQIIGDKINRYMRKKLNFDSGEIEEKRKYFKLKYGTTLSGLMNECKIDPYDFLDYVHNLEYNRLLKRDVFLRSILKNVNGKHFIYTNASYKHAINVLKRLDILDLFNDIVSIETTDFYPKPTEEGFLRFIDKTGIDCKRSIFLDDNINNLITAKKFGIKTVLVGNVLNINNNIDYKINNIYNINKLYSEIIL